jgi:tetratricopeptide (TPR) repeat protein
MSGERGIIQANITRPITGKMNDRGITPLTGQVSIMAPFQHTHSKKHWIPAARVIILAAFIFAFYFLTIRLVSEIYYQKAIHHFQEGYYLPAAEDLEKALYLQPGYVHAWREAGRAYGKLADLYPPDKAFLMAEKSKKALSKAIDLTPLDPQTAFYLAVTEARLQLLYSRLYPDRNDNPYDAFPYFQQAISLRPNSISYHYTLARYLFLEKKKEELLKTVKTLTRIYPSIYNELKKEMFWASDVHQAAKQGLMQAIEKGNEPGKAHEILAGVAESEEDWTEAIDQLKKAMKYGINPDRQKDYYRRLGRFFLENRQIQKAKEAFIEALNSSISPTKDLEGFFGIFEKLGFSKEMPEFYEEVQEHFIVSGQMDIMLAESLYRAGNLDQAEEVLAKINAKTPSADAFYWLAKIAEKKQNVNETGRYYEKAVSLQPANKGYQKELKAFRKRHSK